MQAISDLKDNYLDRERLVEESLFFEPQLLVLLFKHYFIFPHVHATDEKHQGPGYSTFASRISALFRAITWVNLHKDSCISLSRNFIP